jgi:predicted nucleic acid-binding protein
VEQVLLGTAKGGGELFLSVVNAGEVFYRLEKTGHADRASAFLAALRRREFPWALVPATNRRVWEAAAIKARHPVSYADAFAVALARELSAALLIGDPEIHALARQGVVPVEWLPRG